MCESEVPNVLREVDFTGGTGRKSSTPEGGYSTPVREIATG